MTAKSGLVSANGLDKARANFKKVIEPWWQEINIEALMSKLEHPYTGISLSNGFLKGHDAKRVKFLDLYSKEDDRLVPLLAKIELHVELMEEEASQKTLHLRDIKFVDGVSLTFEHGTMLTIPFSLVLQGNIWRGRWPDEQYGGEYVGNSHDSVEKQYHDAVNTNSQSLSQY